MITLHFEESIAAAATGTGGTSGLNRMIVAALSSAYAVSNGAEGADLVVSTSDRIRARPQRQFVIDHGAIADPAFWSERAVHLRRNDTIVVSSRRCAEVIRRMIAEPRPNIVVLPFAVNGPFTELRARATQLRSGLRTELRIPRTSRVVLGVSSFDSRKNIHLGLRLLASAGADASSAHYVLVGQNQHPPQRKAYAEYVAARASEAGIADRVHMIGSHPHERVLELMAASDVLLHLTNCRMENFGLVVAEAMSCGLPVLAADWGGAGELVLDGNAGYLAPTYLSDRGPRTRWLELLRPMRSLLTDQDALDEQRLRAVRHADTFPGVESYQRNLVSAVSQSAGSSDGGGDAHVTLSGVGEEVRFMYYRMLFRTPGIISGKAQMNELLSVGDGRLFREMYGPIATIDEPPAESGVASAYPVVDYGVRDGVIHVTDPAFAQTIAATEPECELAAEAAAAGIVRAPGEAVERLVRLGVLSVLPDQARL